MAVVATVAKVASCKKEVYVIKETVATQRLVE